MEHPLYTAIARGVGGVKGRVLELSDLRRCFIIFTCSVGDLYIACTLCSWRLPESLVFRITVVLLAAGKSAIMRGERNQFFP